MIVFWTLILVLPLLAFGGLAVLSRKRALSGFDYFAENRLFALLLTLIGWFWTAYECHTIGIDVFDMLLKRFPGQLWLMAAVLSFLTFIWMPKNLPVRALMGIFMLMPAEALKTTRLLVPASGFSPVQLLVGLIYCYAVVGMYGMFYPWRIEKAVRYLLGARSAKGN